MPPSPLFEMLHQTILVLVVHPILTLLLILLLPPLLRYRSPHLLLLLALVVGHRLPEHPHPHHTSPSTKMGGRIVSQRGGFKLRSVFYCFIIISRGLTPFSVSPLVVAFSLLGVLLLLLKMSYLSFFLFLLRRQNALMHIVFCGNISLLLLSWFLLVIFSLYSCTFCSRLSSRCSLGRGASQCTTVCWIASVRFLQRPQTPSR